MSSRQSHGGVESWNEVKQYEVRSEGGRTHACRITGLALISH